MQAVLNHQPAREALWPNGKQFAFTIIDDTDTVPGDSDKEALERVRPIYDLLLECG